MLLLIFPGNQAQTNGLVHFLNLLAAQWQCCFCSSRVNTFALTSRTRLCSNGLFSKFKYIFKGDIWWHDNRFEVNWPPEPTLVLRWISKFFLFGALPSDTLKIKHTKKLKEIPSRHVLENLPEKACMNAFIHLKLISNVQGFN